MLAPTVDRLYTHVYHSPVGALYLAVDRGGSVHRIGYTDFRSDDAMEENKYACGELEYQLDQYFGGRRAAFSLEVTMGGTGFQRAVWSRMRKVGFGRTMTYGALAQKIGRRDAAQAVGNAVAANPIVIVIPCHRIVSASGGIGHYARRWLPEHAGREIKHRLLALEGAAERGPGQAFLPT